MADADSGAADAGDPPPPDPGTFDAGTEYRDGTLRVTYSATFSTFLEVHPYYSAEELGSAHAYYMTATNRVDAGTEVLTRFRKPEGNPSDVEVLQIFDWSCLPQAPCDNGSTGDGEPGRFVRTWRLPDHPCWYKMLEDNTGHHVNYLYYRNSSWILEPRDPPADPPLWRNAVSVLNVCTGQYDGVYKHDYAFNQTDCSLADDGDPGTDEGCAGWAGVAERWDEPKPPSILKQGFHQQNLEYDGQSTRLLPWNSAFIDPSTISPPWTVYYLNPNQNWEGGTYQDDDGDDIPNDTDDDIDGDGVINSAEIEACVSTPAPLEPAEWNPYRAPERIDGVFAGTDNDGDTLVDELLPAGTDSLDCDGDGFTGSAEQWVFSRGTTADDQAACAETTTEGDEANDRWPADFNDTRSVNVSDVLALKFVFGTLVPPTSPRYDIAPSGSITVSDVLAVKPLFGRACTTPPGG